MANFEDVMLLCAAAVGQGAGPGEIDLEVLVALREAYRERIGANLATWERDEAQVLEWCRRTGKALRGTAGRERIQKKHLEAGPIDNGGCPYC